MSEMNATIRLRRVQAGLHDRRALAREPLGDAASPAPASRRTRSRRPASRSVSPQRSSSRSRTANKLLFYWLGAGIFVVGSILDILDGALARAGGKSTPFGAFLDSTTDRVGEGAMLAAIALVFARHGHDWAVVFTVAAVVGSFLVPYTRAKAEALGLKGDVGLGSRAERVVAHHRGARLRAVGRPPVGDLPARRDRLDHGSAAHPARPQATFSEEPMATTNGRARLDDGKVRVAIIGVGNCANSLLQGVEYYKDAPDDEFVPGLMHVNLGGYHVRDIEFTAAFDVVKGKVGEDLADAMWAHPNDTIKFADVPKTGIKVSRGMTHDGIGKYLSRGRREGARRDRRHRRDPQGHEDRRRRQLPPGRLRDGDEVVRRADPRGGLRDGELHARVHRARGLLGQALRGAGLPIIGDDIKSQVGATITHRVLTSLFRERGVHLDKTMQLNVGGNSDFLNMLERERLESKKISKTNAVTSMLDYDLGAGQRPRRPVRLRAVADRPQVGLHPDGGHRRSATCRSTSS